MHYKHMISLRVSNDMHKAVNLISKSSNISESTFIRDALLFFIQSLSEYALKHQENIIDVTNQAVWSGNFDKLLKLNMGSNHIPIKKYNIQQEADVLYDFSTIILNIMNKNTDTKNK